MMRYLKYLPLILLFIPAIAWTQNTAPIPTTFSILRPKNARPSDFGLSGMFPSMSNWIRTENLNRMAYTTNRGVGLDSVYFPTDSIYKLTGETLYQFTVGKRSYGQVTNTTDNGADTDSTLEISMRKLTRQSDSSAVYTVWRKRANRRVIDDLGFTFNSNVKRGEKYEIAMTYDRPVRADSLGNQRVVTEHPLSRLTIKTGSDTFAYATGAVATDWFRVEEENLNLLTQLNTPHTSTGAQIGFGYQMSWDGVTAILPLDEVTAYKDSTHLLDNDITGRRGRWNEYSFLRLVGKYMRILYYGVNTTGRVSVDSVAVIKAN